MNRFRRGGEFFHIEMPSRPVTALDQFGITLSMLHSPVLSCLSRLIGILHCNHCTLHLIVNWKMDGLMSQQESDRMRFIVMKLWDLKLQIYMIETESAELTDVIGHVISLMLDLYLENIISRSLFACVSMHLYSR